MTEELVTSLPTSPIPLKPTPVSLIWEALPRATYLLLSLPVLGPTPPEQTCMRAEQLQTGMRAELLQAGIGAQQLASSAPPLGTLFRTEQLVPRIRTEQLVPRKRTEQLLTRIRAEPLPTGLRAEPLSPMHMLRDLIANHSRTSAQNQGILRFHGPHLSHPASCPLSHPSPPG